MSSIQILGDSPNRSPVTRRASAVGLLVFALWVAADAGAAPLAVVESTDFPANQLTPEFVGSLDLGENLISGSEDLNAGFGDTVEVELPPSLEILSVAFTVANYAAVAGNPVIDFFEIDPFLTIDEIIITGDGIHPLDIGGTIAVPDRYGLSVQFAGGSQNVSLDWTWSVEVPEPDVAVSQLAALLALMWIAARWHRKGADVAPPSRLG